MATTPFQWGAGGRAITPAEAASARKMAEALGASRQKVASNGWEGLAQIANALSERAWRDEESRIESEGQESVARLLAGIGPESSFEDLNAVLSNPWASPQQSAVAQALLGQNLKQSDPMYQMERERAALELERLRNPAAPGPEYDFTWGPNGELIRTDATSGGIEALGNYAAPNSADAPKTTTIFDPETGRDQVVQWDAMSGSWVPVGGVAAAPQASPTSGMQEYDAYAADELAAGRQPLSRLEYEQAIRSSGATRINVGDNGQNFPAPPFGQDYRRHPDGTVIVGPNGMPEIVQIPGGPQSIEAEAAALEAEAAAAAAAAQEGAAIASSLEGAEKTLSSTQAVLDLIDSSDTPVAGTGSRPFAVISGTPAGRVRSYVGTLQSGVALGAMQRLKELSSTGATGFGALSAPELQLLINDIGALDPDNTEPDIFRETIARIDGRARRVVADIRKNVSPERIAELGLTEFLEAFDPGGGAQQQQSPFGQSQANPAIFGGGSAGGVVNDPLGIR